MLSKFKNIDYVTANQPNSRQTIANKKKSDYAYLKIERKVHSLKPIAWKFLKHWTIEALCDLFAFRFEKTGKLQLMDTQSLSN